MGCAGRNRPKPIVPTVSKGSCADPARDGVVTEKPSITRADYDLNGVGVLEAAAADKNACDEKNNCYWNLFRKAHVQGTNGQSCWRYIGTIEGEAMRPQNTTGEDRYLDVRGWWRLSSPERMVLSEYRFRDGVYELADSMLCKAMDGEVLQCTASVR